MKKILIELYIKQEIRDAATLLDLPQLVVLLNNIHADESFLNEDTIQHYTLVSDVIFLALEQQQ